MVICFLIGLGTRIPNTNNNFIPIVSGDGVSDHGLLSGLGDDDHTQYILHTELDSEAELESQIVGVTNFWNNNDFAGRIDAAFAPASARTDPTNDSRCL